MIEELRKQLPHCQISDRYRIARKLEQLRDNDGGRQGKGGRQAALQRLSAEVEKSMAACATRAAAIPEKIAYPEILPVSARVAEIGELLQQHQVLIVAGDTGSGKTTQLPKVCLQAGFGRAGMIGHTQPRRLAAVSVADRIAEELHTRVGEGVGYQVRFNEQITPRTYLKLMTDGILLAEIQQDRFLNRYEVIIVDEAHERSLNIDFLLGFLRQLLPKRSDLKLIITSATIDVEKFSRHFDDAPIVAVSGRTYPVETHYMPVDTDADDAQIDGIITALEAIGQEERGQQGHPGDVLVFLASEREIREAALVLRKRRLQNTEILPLYARLRHSEQVRIFKPHRGRRIVLATNVAETSITVPGIKYVIDSGFARISRYSLQSKVQRLPIEAISQASANQRKGRCGRLENGVCIRLYTEQDFESRPLYTDPEIKRTNLASVILRMLHLRLGDVADFPFLEPPQQQAINEGFKLLLELNALTQARKLTDAGRRMASMPVDPRYGRMLVSAAGEACLREMLIIVSALSIQDPRELQGESRQQAQQKLARFNHPESDFLSFVNLWDDYESRRQELSQNQLRKHCKTNFLSFMRMREWREVHRQLLLACQQLGFRSNREPGTYQSIHRSIISGSLNQIAARQEGKTYLGNRNRRFTLFASSALAVKPARWIVTGELIETSQTFATQAARIDPEWVEQMALHLVKREYAEPHWSSKRQSVMAYEKVQLYGLVIIERRPVPYAPIDPAGAREIFIRDGLAADEVRSEARFLLHNRRLMAELAREEEKLRRPDLIISERDVARFYDAVIPETVNSTRQLEQWLGQNRDNASALMMERDALLESDELLEQTRAYPDQAAIARNALRIDYLFEPGNRMDGATMTVPAAILSQLTQADIDWAVPGIIREKCTALIKGLPKTMRKRFIPIKEFVDQAMVQMARGDGDLLDALIACIRQGKGLDLKRADFAAVELPGHLRIKIRVLDEAGDEIGLGEDIAQLQQDLAGTAVAKPGQGGNSALEHELLQSGLKDWSFGELPERVEVGDNLVLIRYPALVDREDSVSVEFFPDQESARQQNRLGLVRLAMLRSVQQKNSLRKQFSRFARELALLTPPGMNDLADELVTACYRFAFNVDEQRPSNREEFESALNRGKAQLFVVADKLERLIHRSFEQRFRILERLRALQELSLAYLVADIGEQLRRLFPEDFLATTEYQWLQQFPRYLDAIEFRLDKAPHVGDKDEAHTELLQAHWRRLDALGERLRPADRDGLRQLRWMLEEFRVSLFAQSLGTRMPISEKRIDKQFAGLTNQAN